MIMFVKLRLKISQIRLSKQSNPYGKYCTNPTCEDVFLTELQALSVDV